MFWLIILNVSFSWNLQPQFFLDIPLRQAYVAGIPNSMTTSQRAWTQWSPGTNHVLKNVKIGSTRHTARVGCGRRIDWGGIVG